MTYANQHLEPTVQGAYDAPAPTDYEYYDVMSLGDTTVEIPEELIHSKIASYNQGDANNDPSTQYACTRYGTTHAVNENNAIEGSQIITDPLQERLVALEEYGAKIDTGDSLRSALAQAKDRRLIAGYAIVRDHYQMKYALTIGQCLYTGTYKCDWEKTRETGVFTPGESYGHAFCVIGFTEEGLVALNSYGDAYAWNGHTGCFLVSWEHTELLFTTYALIDHENIGVIQKEKVKRDEEALVRQKDLGTWNGLRGDEGVSRREVVLMIDRVFQNLKNSS